jgi:hypothetical protein
MGKGTMAKRSRKSKQCSFVVKRYLHMGLKVKPGKEYTESDLLRRCEGDSDKLNRLKRMMMDPTMLEFVSKGALSRKPRMNSALPQLGPGLKTYVINLKRRPDRLAHIKKTCCALGLEPDFVEAVDGQALAKSSGHIKEQGRRNGATKKPLQRSNKEDAPRGCNQSNRMYEASWLQKGKQCKMKMAMAFHRVAATKLTAEGHEVWGAIGCNLSHQAVLERFIADPSAKWCLILEDDATLDMPGLDAQKLFAKGIRLVQKRCPNWALVHLGGCLSTFQNSDGENEALVKTKERVGNILVQGHKIYQTHAFLLRKTIAEKILANLKAGFAADAALVSFTRKSPERCFIFKPRMILLQPGGGCRWKDSDIFVEGAEFRQEAARKAERDGKTYAFEPKLRHRALKAKLKRK